MASKRSFQRAKTWLQICTQNRGAHANCPIYKTPLLPKRVIDVSSLENPEVIRLSTSLGQRGDYAALSYCWGGPQTEATTLLNLDSRKIGFKLSSLPRTLRDAVITTRQLGLRFLWVDAICILQDSTADKEVEMSTMAQVYKNAFVTIIAGYSKSCYEGFLEDRSSRRPKIFPKQEDIVSPWPELHDIWIFNLPYRCPDGTLGSLSLTK